MFNHIRNLFGSETSVVCMRSTRISNQADKSIAGSKLSVVRASKIGDLVNGLLELLEMAMVVAQELHESV